MLRKISKYLVPLITLLLIAAIGSAQQKVPIPTGQIPVTIPTTKPVAPATPKNPTAVSVARLHYGGGGDWYLGNSSIPNLLEFIKNETGWPVDSEEKQVRIDDQSLFSHPFLFATGHGHIRFTEDEAERLRMYLLAGGFLFINDSYGMDKSVRSAVLALFPERPFEEIPYDHPIYHSFFDFPNGPPKIHEHDNQPATGWGINIDGRLVLYYLHESDIGDGWEDAHVHNDPPEKRLEALKMGLNIVTYSMMY